MKQEVELKIEEALESIRPFLKADGGNVELVNVDEELNVSLRLLGACKNCDISQLTMKAGIEESIRKILPSVKSVTAVN
jgi:Fe-S cluster biogenesis protein NfuA